MSDTDYRLDNLPAALLSLAGAHGAGRLSRPSRVMRVFMLKVSELTGTGNEAFFLYSFELPRWLTGDRSMLEHIPACKQNYVRYCTLPPPPMFVKRRFVPFEWAKRPNRRLDYFDDDPKSVPRIRIRTLLKNGSNSLIIPGNTHVADIYTTEFMRMFDHYRIRDDENNPGVPKIVGLTEDDSWSAPYFDPSTKKPLHNSANDSFQYFCNGAMPEAMKKSHELGSTGVIL